jgi:hypothetical protein
MQVRKAFPEYCNSENMRVFEDMVKSLLADRIKTEKKKQKERRER